MTSASSNDLVTFNPSTRAAFLQYLRENPNNHCISQTDKEIIIEWLTNPHKRPSSQQEFSRRNYVRKIFAWDERTRNLLSVAKTNEDKYRTVVAEDMIADVIELVHKDSGHAGWDCTWKDVTTACYGILRSDVIFLLKQCQICAINPSKRPKGSAAMMLSPQQVDREALEFLSTDDVRYNKSTWDVPENEKHPGE